MKLILNSVLAIILVVSSTSYADVSVVVNTGNANSMSDKELSRLFLGKLKKFSDGTSAVPVNSKVGTISRAEFEHKVLNKTSKQIKAYWSKRMFSGKGKPPQEEADDAAVLAFVAANAGAIGYVDAASVNASVKVIKSF